MFSRPSLLTRWSTLILQVGVSYWWQNKSCKMFANIIAKWQRKSIHMCMVFHMAYWAAQPSY